MSNFDDSDINLWIVSFGVNDCYYVHHKLGTVINTIREFAESELYNIDEDKRDDFNDMLIDNCIDTLISSDIGSNVSLILTIGEKLIIVRRLTLDKHNVIHKLLSDSYEFADDSLKARISNLFSTI